jgi:hypothetical protein
MNNLGGQWKAVRTANTLEYSGGRTSRLTSISEHRNVEMFTHQARVTRMQAAWDE